MVKITKIAGSPKVDLNARKLFMEAKQLREREALAELQLLWNEFKEKRYGKRYEMLLTNELPRFGSGHRTFFVKEGRKWAHFTMHVGNPDNTTKRIRGRMPMKKWNELKIQQQQLEKRNDPDEVRKRHNSRRRRPL